eukprot:TRINITY_DN7790_c0_g1_i5.p1 TRINITY_DN7790_c0_g1~~TRINITY_DN7790_c0_g1_i5.p1  ORF type:complete len:328 (+),score=66.93 TRINITY_DN7790_c0_g1_i5:127-1110(+)
MALYLRARDYKKQITAAHFAAADRAANRNMIEFRAAIDIQRFVRGCFARGRIHHKHRAATKIQKVFRGYVGRKIVHQKVNEAQQRNRRSFFNKMATQIQKIFRGFYSRKYLHDYYARKHYIDAILKKNDATLENLRHHATELDEMEKERAREEHEKSVHQITAKMHHLLSTKTTAGVFNSPYQRDSPPTVLGIQMEEQIRRAGKEKLHQPPTENTDGVKLPPIKSPGERPTKKSSRISLQASSPYNIVEAARSEERRLENSMRLDKRDFVPTVRPDGLFSYANSVNTGVPYGLKTSFRETSSTTSTSKKPFCSASTRGSTFDEMIDS